MRVPDYFAEVYGYPFDTATHGAVLTMHGHRMRERVGDSAEVLRENGELWLVASRAIVLRDPRCEEPMPQRVLRVLATGGPVGSKELARTLGVPVRTIQKTLKELHADDDLVLVKDGRLVLYVVEDTTFSEPTRSRRFGGDLFARSSNDV